MYDIHLLMKASATNHQVAESIAQATAESDMSKSEGDAEPSQPKKDANQTANNAPPADTKERNDKLDQEGQSPASKSCFVEKLACLLTGNCKALFCTSRSVSYPSLLGMSSSDEEYSATDTESDSSSVGCGVKETKELMIVKGNTKTLEDATANDPTTPGNHVTKEHHDSEMPSLNYGTEAAGPSKNSPGPDERPTKRARQSLDQLGDDTMGWSGAIVETGPTQIRPWTLESHLNDPWVRFKLQSIQRALREWAQTASPSKREYYLAQLEIEERRTAEMDRRMGHEA
ncbi:MAG: hypothetical protein L6R41_003907 [Letrouitia leprolyta]|nr:MAG: hypothetical protein L6R41_003907 [Letrouitia leprolyta]